MCDRRVIEFCVADENTGVLCSYANGSM